MQENAALEFTPEVRHLICWYQRIGFRLGTFGHSLLQCGQTAIEIVRHMISSSRTTSVCRQTVRDNMRQVASQLALNPWKESQQVFIVSCLVSM